MLYCLYNDLIHTDIIQYADYTTLIIPYNRAEDLQLKIDDVTYKVQSYLTE